MMNLSIEPMASRNAILQLALLEPNNANAVEASFLTQAN
jgi:hypothetical protein